jgi:hypothetical protein
MYKYTGTNEDTVMEKNFVGRTLLPISKFTFRNIEIVRDMHVDTRQHIEFPWFTAVMVGH